MATRRPVPKSPADEMVESKRRAMRAELAEALGYSVARRLTFDDLVRLHPQQQETSRRSQVDASRKNEARLPIGHVRRVDAPESKQSAASPYGRGKAQSPHQATAEVARKTRSGTVPAKDQVQPVAKRNSGR